MIIEHVEYQKQKPVRIERIKSIIMSGDDTVWCSGYKDVASGHYIMIKYLITIGQELRCPDHGYFLLGNSERANP